MKRFLAMIFSVCLLTSALALLTRAHPGGTDASGGHIDQSTDEYHYHHGYPAHYHTGGSCPYDFDDKTGQSSGSPSNGANGSTSSLPNNSNSSSNKIDTGEVIAYVGVGIIALFTLYIFISVIIDKLPGHRAQEATQQTSPKPTQPPNANFQETSPPPVSKSVPPSHPNAPTSTQHIILPEASAPRPLTIKNGIIADYPDILDANPAYLTEAQILAYALSIETPRGKKAVTEPFQIKNKETDISTTPHHVSASVTSLNSSQEYATTLVRCSCPDHRARRLPCKHMIALAIHVNAITVNTEALQKHQERS